jgi:hypothetical protein
LAAASVNRDQTTAHHEVKKRRFLTDISPPYSMSHYVAISPLLHHHERGLDSGRKLVAIKGKLSLLKDSLWPAVH